MQNDLLSTEIYPYDRVIRNLKRLSREGQTVHFLIVFLRAVIIDELSQTSLLKQAVDKSLQKCHLM